MVAIRIRLLLLISVLQSFLVVPIRGIIKKVDLDIVLGLKCPPALIICSCGFSENEVQIKVEQCSHIVRLKAKCQPCNGKTPENVCPKFSNCAQCEFRGGDRCLRCPPDRYGTWCEYKCYCYNDGICGVHGDCVCPEGFEGVQCEKRKGCSPPDQVTSPLRAVFKPPNFPLLIEYSCEPKYHLQGNTISSCLPGDHWSTPPPKCILKCPLLSAPANGRITFDGSDLIEGVTAEFTCDTDHQLAGVKKMECLANGTWSADLPQCEELAFCSDPGFVRYARRVVSDETQRNREIFHQGVMIHFDCKQGFQQMGTSSIVCLRTGEWSSAKPSCVKASAIIPDCQTVGSDVVAGVDVPVRILCPPECTYLDTEIWGTSIYRIGSAVCPAAIHAGKITNSGGLVAIINNGKYTSFAGSSINSIQSHSYDDSDQSFRFDKLPPLVQNREKGGKCPEGLIKLEDICVIISTYPRPEEEAEATCKNFGLSLQWPTSEGDQQALLLLLENKGISQLWTGTISAPVSTIILELNDTSDEVTNSTTTETPFLSSKPQCETVKISGLDFVPQNKECGLQLHYVCSYNPSATLASCTDPGDLSDGKTKHIGKIRDTFYVGSSIEYTCKSLHYMTGDAKIQCRSNGTWSNEKPTCTVVPTCDEQQAPFAGYVSYLPPLDTPMAQRMAMSRAGHPGLRFLYLAPGHDSTTNTTIKRILLIQRNARLPIGLDAKPGPDTIPFTTTPGPKIDIELPPGKYRVGTTATYECESRYYQLVGSKARRCQEMGQWSGRPPTCIPVCGKSDSPRAPFIVNGNATDIGQWPWQSGIARYIPDYDQWFLLCGGSLLSERWIITAAHCVVYGGTTMVIDTDKFRVYLGKYHRSDSKDDNYVQTKTIREIHIHPDYDPGIFDADIALIQLETPVRLNSRVQPICLPTEQTSRANLKSGSKGVVTGWGMNENDSYADTLQQAVLPVVSNEECEQGYIESGLPLDVTENMFCAGFKRGRNDACSGDSGGPIVFADDSAKERRWVLEGIVSWGSPQGCGNPDQYGGYTTVSKFLNWIHLFF